MTQVWCFVVSVFLIGSVQCYCDLTDEACLTRRGNDSYHLIVNGIEGKVPSSDPLNVDLLEAILPSIYYKIINGTLAGIKNCYVIKVKINNKDSTFEYHIECPVLFGHSDYEVKGKIGTFDIEGKGEATVTFEDYVIMLTGAYEKYLSENGKHHLRITNYDVDMDARGHVKFELTNLFGGDTEKSAEFHKYIDANWKSFDKAIRKPAIKEFMKSYISNLNTFMEVVALEDIK